MSMLVISTAFASAGTAALAIEMIGPPPRWGIASLWVHDHRAAVRTLVVATGIALACLLAAVGLRAGRLAVLLVCAGLAGLLLWRHPEAIRTIAAVIRSRHD